MHVRVREAGDRDALKFDPLGARPDVRLETRSLADRKDPPTGNREGPRPRTARIERHHPPDEQDIGGDSRGLTFRGVENARESNETR